MLVRIGAPVGHLHDLIAALPAEIAARARWLLDPPHGMAYALLSPTGAEDAAAWLAAVRTLALSLAGYAVVLSAPEDLSTQLDDWGVAPDSLALMRGLKARWDPAGILNVGAFLV